MVDLKTGRVSPEFVLTFPLTNMKSHYVTKLVPLVVVVGAGCSNVS